MSRERRKPGDVVVAANGYSYTYEEGPDGKPVRTLTHWIVGRRKYGRAHGADEMVKFKDGNRANLEPDNIIYVPKNNNIASLRRRRNTLLDKIREYQEEIKEIEEQLKKAGVSL